MSHRAATIEIVLPDEAATIALGARLAALVRSGDLVVLSGDLGAGKTTLTRGIGAALGIRGAVTSPTFVLSRIHPSLAEGPDLVHVDAYRLGSAAEIDDLDLDLERSVTVVEWGAGRVEHLSDSRLDIRLDSEEPGRVARITPVGPRWDSVDLAMLARPAQVGG